MVPTTAIVSLTRRRALGSGKKYCSPVKRRSGSEERVLPQLRSALPRLSSSAPDSFVEKKKICAVMLVLEAQAILISCP